jgi:hypothetical protein
MYLHRVIFASLLALTALLAAGCSKKESTPTQPSGAAPTVPTVNFKGPNTTSTDANAQATKSYVQAMNGCAAVFTPFVSLPAQQSGNTWTWTYTDRTLTVKFTCIPQSDGSYQWALVLNGTDPSSGTVYNNWTEVDGATTADGKNGSWRIYDVNRTTVAAEYEWTTTGSVLTGTLKAYTNGVLSGQTVVVNNPDNSGELRVYTGTKLTYKSVWQTNGSGQWWTYDLNGNQTGTGTWT